MSDESLSSEYWRRRRISDRASMPLSMLLFASTLGTRFAPEWAAIPAIFLAASAAGALVSLTVWAWRCTACGSGMKLDGLTCSKCGRVFSDDIKLPKGEPN